MVLSFAVGSLGPRAARDRPASDTSERDERTVVRLKRQLIALTLFFGAICAVASGAAAARGSSATDLGHRRSWSGRSCARALSSGWWRCC